MNTSFETTQPSEKKASRPWVAGALLILIGVLFLAERFLHFPGWSILPALAVIFLAWGLLARSTGLLIPGGVLAGIGAAAYLLDGPFANAQDPAKGGMFFLVFAAGWLLIMLLSTITEAGHKPILWPLFPAGGLALFGGMLLAGEIGLKALDLLGQGWPIALIVIGLYLALRRKDIH